ncbi:MAG: universal stress protein [Thermoleophilia bacterium]|nr:universal stress protein [Thermoleophilia bacterium]
MEEKGFRRILLAYDGSEDSEKAAALAITLAEKFDSTIIVCHAFGHMPQTSKPSEVRRLVNPLVDRLAKLGIPTLVAVPDALPAQGILDAAEEHHADLILMGSRGRGTFANLLLGSTSERVLRYAKVPVMIAR